MPGMRPNMAGLGVQAQQPKVNRRFCLFLIVGRFVGLFRSNIDQLEPIC